jgi:nitroreductase
MGTSLIRRDLVVCVEAATAAPSVYNSQPWRFRLRHDRVEVFPDRTRRLERVLLTATVRAWRPPR